MQVELCVPLWDQGFQEVDVSSSWPVPSGHSFLMMVRTYAGVEKQDKWSLAM